MEQHMLPRTGSKERARLKTNAQNPSSSPAKYYLLLSRAVRFVSTDCLACCAALILAASAGASCLFTRLQEDHGFSRQGVSRGAGARSIQG